jgi:hypothetical protein
MITRTDHDASAALSRCIHLLLRGSEHGDELLDSCCSVIDGVRVYTCIHVGRIQSVILLPSSKKCLSLYVNFNYLFLLKNKVIKKLKIKNLIFTTLKN